MITSGLLYAVAGFSYLYIAYMQKVVFYYIIAFSFVLIAIVVMASERPHSIHGLLVILQTVLLCYSMVQHTIYNTQILDYQLAVACSLLLLLYSLNEITKETPSIEEGVSSFLEKNSVISYSSVSKFLDMKELLLWQTHKLQEDKYFSQKFPKP